jgi:GNAT superfamily N-acetyltransferase
VRSNSQQAERRPRGTDTRDHRPRLVIRRFRPSDQDAARQLILAGLAEHFGHVDAARNPDLHDIRASYLAQGDTFLVAQCGADLVGTAALVAAAASSGRVVRMSVHSTFRRRGIARALLARLVSLARRRGMRELLVETNNDWQAAIALYARNGFVEYHRDAESVYMRLAL